MSDEEIRYVSDPTQPNAGRVYDYILGGDYNFPVDQKVADELLKKVPSIRSSMKLVRLFLGNAVDRAFKMGFLQFLDFASGLPTVDHIHTRIPENLKDKVKIMYSDIDPITVQIGKDIIGNNPLLKFLKCDCRKPETLLESDAVKNLFNINEKFVIGYNGIFYFLADEHINHAMKVLYEWSPKNSIIYFCDFDSEAIKDTPAIQEALNYYKSMNQPGFPRPISRIKYLVKPWKIMEPGLQKFEKWLNISIDISKEFLEETGVAMYGGFLEK